MSDIKDAVRAAYDNMHMQRADVQSEFHAIMVNHPKYADTKAYKEIAKIFRSMPRLPGDFESRDDISVLVSASVDRSIFEDNLDQIKGYLSQMVDESMDNVRRDIDEYKD